MHGGERDIHDGNHYHHHSASLINQPGNNNNNNNNNKILGGLSSKNLYKTVISYQLVTY